MAESMTLGKMPVRHRQSSLGQRSLRWFFNLVFAIFAVFIIAAAAIYAGMRVEGYRFYNVLTGSMRPSLSAGSVVGIEQIAPHEVKEGDVIAFNRGGRVIIHRVIDVHADTPDFRSTVKDASGNIQRQSINYAPRTYTTMGDANPAPDPQTVSQDDLLGVASFKVPWPLNLIATHLTKQTLYFTGLGALVLFIAWELSSLAASLRQKRRSRGITDSKRAPAGQTERPGLD